MRTRRLYALFGLLAALLGMAAGHFVAALLDPASSPVLAVGSAVIDLTPTPVKEWAIAQFGTKDKPILIGSVLLGVLALAAVAGLLARRRFRYGAALLVGLVAVAAVAVLTRPTVEPRRRGAQPGHRARRRGRAVAAGPPRAWYRGRGAGWPAEAATGPQPSRRGHRDGRAGGLRRRARWHRPLDPAATAPGRGHRPAGRRGPGAGRCRKGLDDQVPGITEWVTAERGLLPGRHPPGHPGRQHRRLDADHRRRRRERAHDHVRRAARDADDRARHHPDLRLQQRRRRVRRRCSMARRTPPGPARPGRRRQQGRPDPQHRLRRDDDQHPARAGHRRPRRDDLRRHERRAAAPRARLPGADGDPRALRLHQRHQVADQADADDVRRQQEAYWTERDWATEAPIKISARIDTPRALAKLDAGENVVGGIAWCQQAGGVGKVEVQVDGGGWKQATLGPTAATTTGGSGTTAGTRSPASTASRPG